MILEQVGHKNIRLWLWDHIDYNYDIIYKKGKENVVANALLWKYEKDMSLLTFSLPVLDGITKVP